MTVKELLSRIDSLELSEWRDYYQTQPWDVKGDLHAGIVAATIANVNRGKNSKAFQPSDFMPLQTQPDQDEDEMKEIMNQIAGGNNGNSR